MIIAGNILNIIAPIIQIISCTLKNKTKVLFGVIIASITWVIAYCFLGLTSAAVLSACGIVVPIINFIYEKRGIDKPWWFYFSFIIIIAVITIIFYSELTDILPSLAVLFLLLSTLPKKQLPFRVLLICMSLTWLIYGIINNEYGIIIGNSIQIFFLIVTIFLYSFKNKRDQS